jgi:hypothetical protein
MGMFAKLMRVAALAIAGLAMALASAPASARHVLAVGGAMGNAGALAECPPGQMLVGFSGRAGVWIDRIQLVCATPMAGGGLTQPIATGATYGGAGGGAQDGFCARNMMLTSIQLNLTTNDRQVAAILMTCKSRVTGEETNMAFGNAAYRPNCGGGLGVGNCPTPANIFQHCPGGEAPVGLNVRYGTDVNGIGLICAPVADTAAAAPPPAPAPVKAIKQTGRAKPPSGPGLAPVSAFGGKWQTVTNLGGHFELILQTNGEGIGMMGMPVQMQVGGSFTNTDGSHDYDGTISGVVPPGARQLIYNFSQKNGQGGQGTFTLSNDGNSLTGDGVVSGTHFTWNGQRAP